MLKGNWSTYKNGNYHVAINTANGTKIRFTAEDHFAPDTVESMDIKITDRCHNGCCWCHENSTCYGKHGDILAPSFIDKLHPYTELAIGGGNPLEHPDLELFLEKLQALKMIPSMTIRQNDFMANLDLLESLTARKLIYGLGISLVDPLEPGFLNAVKNFTNAVIHVINGVVTADQMEALSGQGVKLLILGYKEVRRGRDLYVNEKEKYIIDSRKREMYDRLSEYLTEDKFAVVSFDNLAIEQLDPKRFVTGEKWSSTYQGDDGIGGEMTSASMFVDMVERKFARNSCDLERHDLLPTIEEMYNFLRNNIKQKG